MCFGYANADIVVVIFDKKVIEMYTLGVCEEPNGFT